MKYCQWATLLAAVSFGCLSPAGATPFTYQLVKCENLQPVAVITTGISDAGAIVGGWIDASGKVHGLLVGANGACQTLDKPGSQQTLLTDINNRGQIAGFTWDPAPDGRNVVARPFVFQNGVFVSLEDSLRNAAPPGATICGGTAMGINNQGQVVGRVDVAPPNDPCWNGDETGQDYGYLREANGTAVIFLEAGPYTGNNIDFMGINESGWIVGMGSMPGPHTFESAFLRSPEGVFQVFGYPGSCKAELIGINARREAVGVYFPDCDRDDVLGGRGFYRAPNGALTELSHPEAQMIGAFKINASGVVTGFWVSPAGNIWGLVARKTALF